MLFYLSILHLLYLLVLLIHFLNSFLIILLFLLLLHVTPNSFISCILYHLYHIPILYYSYSIHLLILLIIIIHSLIMLIPQNSLHHPLISNILLTSLETHNPLSLAIYTVILYHIPYNYYYLTYPISSSLSYSLITPPPTHSYTLLLI